MATAQAERRDGTTGTYRKVPLLNVYVHDVTMDEVLENFDEGLILTLHTDMLMKLQKDRAFYEIFDRFDLVTCDSQILFFAAKLLGTPLRERVSGSDFFPRFYMRHKDNPDVRIFLCGGLPGVAEEAAAKINRKAGRDIVVGCDAPAFDYETRSTASCRRSTSPAPRFWSWALAAGGRRSSSSPTRIGCPRCGCSCRLAERSTTRPRPCAAPRPGSPMRASNGSTAS
jgi:hypothetical protein